MHICIYTYSLPTSGKCFVSVPAITQLSRRTCLCVSECLCVREREIQQCSEVLAPHPCWWKKNKKNKQSTGVQQHSANAITHSCWVSYYCIFVYCKFFYVMSKRVRKHFLWKKVDKTKKEPPSLQKMLFVVFQPVFLMINTPLCNWILKKIPVLGQRSTLSKIRNSKKKPQKQTKTVLSGTFVWNDRNSPL